MALWTVACALSAAPVQGVPLEAPSAPHGPLGVDLRSVPLAFEPAGPATPDAPRLFRARGAGYTAVVGPIGAAVAIRAAEPPDAPPALLSSQDAAAASRRLRARAQASRSRPDFVRVRFENANPAAEANVQSPVPGKVHRLIGSSPDGWRTGLQAHQRVVYSEVYPGIDVAFHGNGREVEYDFIIAPGASPETPRLRFEGARSMSVDSGGNLRLETPRGTLLQRAPVAYQDGPDGREFREVAYRLRDDGAAEFQMGDYDPGRPLVIDPVLSYATFIGGSGVDQCWDVAVDAAGAAFVVGETESDAFPELALLSTNGFLTNYQGGLQNIAGDAFVAKLNPAGTAFEWFTYLGGSDLDVGFSVSLTAGGDVVVGGFTSSTNFPVSAGAFQTTVAGETNRFTGRRPLDAFVARLSPDGSSLAAATLFGGEGEDQILDLAVLDDGRVVAVGSTSSTNLPLPATAAQATYGGALDAFIAVFSADATSVTQGSFLGGSARDSAEGVAWDEAAGIAHVTGITASTNLPVSANAPQPTLAGGYDAFVAGYRVADGSWTRLTYLGGAGDDFGYRIAVDLNGAPIVVGQTGSTEFPVVAALQSTNAGGIDGFMARLSADGSTLTQSTYFGGPFEDALWDAHQDALGNIHLVGDSYSSTLPGLDATSVQSTNRGLADIVIARLAQDGTLHSSFFGGTGDDLAYGVAADPAGNAYVAGRVRSVGFPVSGEDVAQSVYGGGTMDGFVLKVIYEPSVEAVRTDDGFEVSWPAPNPGFVLESTSSPATSDAVWAPVDTPVEVVDGKHRARVPLNAGSVVFRLRRE
jgi:hypothetical protein